jgi:YD repeat-containing protein
MHCQTSTGCDLLASHTYNTQHQLLTSTDASAQTTTFTYLADGRLETVVTPPRNGPDGQPLTLAERKTIYTYYPDNDPNIAPRKRLQTIAGPSSPQGPPTTIYVYDTKGRVLTSTDTDSYTLTYAYDDLDRQTRVTYPDTTYEETVYKWLDAAEHRDRLGRWSHSFYDALRRLTTTRDPQGRTVQRDYCTCGSLDRLICS